MAYAMTKQGSLDNCVTYEFICDTIDDMNSIENKYRTLGTVAIVLEGDGGLEVYIAGSNKEWNSMSAIGGGSSSGSGSSNAASGLSIYVCAQNEVRFGRPNISSPNSKVVYLVPASNATTGNLYDEYIYVNNKWEKFGSSESNIDLSDYITQDEADEIYVQRENPEFTGSISLNRAANSSAGDYSIAMGYNTVASGDHSYAEGYESEANNSYSHAEGYRSEANGSYSHAEGQASQANGLYSHAEGSFTQSNGNYSHAEGQATIAEGGSSHVSGQYNVLDSYLNVPVWQPNTQYYAGDIIRFDSSASIAYYKIQRYICLSNHISENSVPQQLNSSLWLAIDNMKYAEIVGNGTNGNSRSNARALDWNGNEYLKGDIYVGCNADSTGGTKLEPIPPMPTVTTADNGKVLEVVDGEWKRGSEKVPIVYEWLDKTWNRTTAINGNYIWMDGDNIYYSYNTIQYILDRSTSTWSKKTWNGLTSINGIYIWIDGDNIYYSNLSNQYILDKSTSTWNEKTWNVKLSYGDDIWTDGDNIYYSHYNAQYVLDRSTSTWNEKTWNGLTDFLGGYIWTDGINIYYSNATKQYILDKANSRWSSISWNGLTNFFGQDVWTDGKNVYYSSNTKQYVLDKSASTWIPSSLNGLTGYYGSDTWTDGDNVYYSANDSQKILFIHSNLSDYILNSSKGAINGVATLDSYGKIPGNQSTRTPGFVPIDWKGPSPLSGENVWTDGDNIYYSKVGEIVQGEAYNLVLDKSTHTWSIKTWYGQTAIYGKDIWTDGTDIYYSYYYDGTSKQFVLDKSNSTWEQKTWNGLTEFNGEGIWTDGINIYYNDGYVLDKSTSTWISKTWDFTFSSNNIWTDGDNIYYSWERDQRVLNKSTSTWSPMVWNGSIPSYANYIWTDGNNIYYNNQYILDKATSTWLTKTWDVPLINIRRSDIWNDGVNYYYSNQYQLIVPRNLAAVDYNGNLVDSEKSLYDFPLISPPATDGTYTLQVTVTNGVPTYSWV